MGNTSREVRPLLEDGWLKACFFLSPKGERFSLKVPFSFLKLICPEGEGCMSSGCSFRLVGLTEKRSQWYPMGHMGALEPCQKLG